MINKFRYILRNRWNRTLNEFDVNIEQLKKMQNSGAIIVDVRNPLEYEEGHISGAISMPDYEITKMIEQRIKNKNIPIILYCKSGNRSKKAQKKLNNIGYTKVYNLFNGIENY